MTAAEKQTLQAALTGVEHRISKMLPSQLDARIDSAYNRAAGIANELEQDANVLARRYLLANLLHRELDLHG